MIVKLGIQNFQSIKSARLEFHPGVTVITGPSGSGKTALMRAMHSLVVNPKGSQRNISYGAEKAIVAMRFGDAPVVSWYRDKKSTTYKVGDVVSEKAGKSNIASVTTGFPLLYDGDSKKVLNFLGEWDKLFPFGKTPSEMFLMFEDIFKIDPSSDIIELMREDVVAQQRVVSEVSQQIEVNKVKVSAIAEAELKVSVAELEKLSVRLNDVETRFNSLVLETSVSENLVKALEGMKGLVLREFDLAVLDISGLQEDFRNVEGMAKVAELSFVRREFDLTKVEGVGLLEVDCSRALECDKVLSIEGLALKEFDLSLVLRSLNLQEDVGEALELVSGLDQFDGANSRNETERREISEELGKFSVCPLCQRPLEGITHDAH